MVYELIIVTNLLERKMCFINLENFILYNLHGKKVIAEDTLQNTGVNTEQMVSHSTFD